MNASTWDAIAEVGGFTIILGGVLGTIVVALLRMRFVTRAEHTRSHDAIDGRIKGVEAGLATKVSKEDLLALSGRLYANEQGLSTTNVKLAETNALLQANTEVARALSRQIDMLYQNELAREK